jgi:signal transduction histidine kinase
MTRRYVLALAAVALLAVSGLAAFQALAAAYDRTLAVVNMSGRQRMLSQRIALYVDSLADGGCSEDRRYCVRELELALDDFQRAHDGLAHGSATLDVPGPTSAAVATLYFSGEPSLHQRVLRYIRAARQVAEAPPETLSPDHPAVVYVLTEGPGRLLKSLDQVVLQYQTDGEAAYETLRRLEIIVVGLTLLTILLEALLIFRPMVRRTQAQFGHIERMADRLRHANETLEHRVAERTRDLADAKAEAEKANQAKSKFLAAAGHDMLQPLQAAEMFTGLLADEPLSSRGDSLLTDLRRTQTSLRHLVRSVLDVSKLEAGTITPSIQAVTIRPMLEALSAEFSPLALDKDLRLNLVAPDAVVESDPVLLERILRNLIGNALRYTHTGGIVLGVRLRDDRVWIQVADSGIGIAPEDLSRIWKEFVQVGPQTHDRSEGLGLGLAIVDRQCRLLGHRVSVRSRPGHGSIFTVDCRRWAP